MKRLLYIAHRVPYPPDKGERVRAFNEIKALAPHYRITLAAPTFRPEEAEAAEQLKPWCERVITAPAGRRMPLVRGALSLLRGRSVTEGYFSSRALRRAIRQEASREPFELVMGYSSGVLRYVLDVPAPGRIMDLVDVDSAKWRAYADQARGPKRWLYRAEARAVQSLEELALERCQAVLLVSQAEVGALSVQSPKAIAVSNGVDLDYFRPDWQPDSAWSGIAPGTTTGQPHDGPSLVFTGQMDYRPNVEGVCWFVREVWPELKKAVPSLAFTIVGRNPAPAVRALAATPGITVTGVVPDVRPYLAAATVVVVPLHIARGIQNKILEAMAMARAVVASPAALGGLQIQPGEVLSADSPADWRQQITDLLRDSSRRTQVGLAARLRVEASYSWARQLAALPDICRRLEATPCAAGGVPEARPVPVSHNGEPLLHAQAEAFLK